MSKMQHLWLCLFLIVIDVSVNAQEAKEEPAKVVLNLLSGQMPLKKDSIEVFLTSHSWESLAYWDSELPAEKSNLFEAVPDIYRFDDSGFQLILYSDSNSKNSRIKGDFRIKDDILQFVDPQKMRVIDTWKLIYVDRNYLAVDMEGLRVFMVSPDNDPF